MKTAERSKSKDGKKYSQMKRTENETMKVKLVAGSGKFSFRLLTDEEIKDLGAEDLKPPLCYGLVTSLGWNFNHTKVGNVIVFDINNCQGKQGHT
jgi:hypothetical protein